MRRKHVVIGLLFGALTVLPAWGQRVTVDGLVQEQELISLTQNIPFDQALRVIQTLANRVVVDPQHLTAPIGIDIDRVPWRQALDRIALEHGLQVVVQENYLELQPLPVRTVEGPGAVAALPEVTLDSREVNISAVFFQAEQAVLREFGIDWSTLSGGRVNANVSNLAASSNIVESEFTAAVGADISRSLSVDFLMQAIESIDSGEIIAKPQVKVRSGQVGYIQVGQDFQVITIDFAGNPISQFFQTGTILTVEPEIITEDGIDFVDLKVEAERSSLIDPDRNLISKTVARTSALLRDGEQTAVGGLYGQEVLVTRSGVPLLKDLPAWVFGLRYLFGFESRSVSKTELVITLELDIVPSVRQRHEHAMEQVEVSGADTAPYE